MTIHPSNLLTDQKILFHLIKMNAIIALNSINIIEDLEGRQRRRKSYKERVDWFHLPDISFKYKYRFNKTTVRSIIELVEDDLVRDPRGAGISPELQVLVAIRCWARREVQDDAGDLHGLSQPTVSRICAQVARAIAPRAASYIKMPSGIEEEQRIMNKFCAIKNFPGVIGAIDCTHIKIKKTGGELAQYYINRKGYYSLNVQVVCDADLKIIDIVARWRGSTHDSRIFNECQLKQRFEEGHFRGRLLGDSGYPLLPYLFTPLLRPTSPREERYNEAQISTRNTVERCFGVWKQRFQCLLLGMPVKFFNVKTAIIALAVLHNIAIEMNDSLLDDVTLFEDEVDIEEVRHNVNHVAVNAIEPIEPRALRRRSQMILHNFISQNF